MDGARARAKALVTPTWFTAAEQTKARGREGRAWSRTDGAFAATLLMFPNCPAPQAAQRSFVVANALRDALAQFIDQTRLSQKWPNDVLLNGGKVAGILLEASGQGRLVDWLSIGVGVNLGRAPKVQDAAFAPVGLADQGGAGVTPEAFLPVLARCFAAHETAFVAHGFARTRDDWLTHAARLGDVITARTSREEITGTFDTIDAEGNLVLLTATGPRAIPAADIYF